MWFAPGPGVSPKVMTMPNREGNRLRKSFSRSHDACGSCLRRSSNVIENA